jgi:hypothetical protein
MSHGQTSLAVKGPVVKCHFGQVFLILVASQKSRGQMSLAVKCPAVKCHLRSNVSRSNVTCGQMSRGQMSLWSNVPRSNVSRSNVPRSNVTCGQMSRGQMSLVVKCPAVKCHCGHMSQNLEVVKSPWSNVPWSNETVVIGDPIQ